jgi:hypothetical protein
MHLWPGRLAFYYLLLLSPTSVSALQIGARPLPEDSGKPERNTSLLLLAALSCPNISICSSETKAQQTIRGDAGTETACLVEVPGKEASSATATYSSTGRVAASWQPRSYDFNVATKRKYLQKLNYMHSNPVRRGLVSLPEAALEQFQILLVWRRGAGQNRRVIDSHALSFERDKGKRQKPGPPAGSRFLPEMDEEAFRRFDVQACQRALFDRRCEECWVSEDRGDQHL